jgi:hypothetical protein
MIIAALPSQTSNSTRCSPIEAGLSSIEWTNSPFMTGHRQLPTRKHEITYLIIDLRGEPGTGPPYRVSVVNGDRLMYEVESALVADLNTIEGSRCAGCTPCPHESGAVAAHSFLLEVSCET